MKVELKNFMTLGLQRLNLAINKPKWHNLRTTVPISKSFGYDRGQPVDRYYIERFLEEKKSVIRGEVLEISEDTYTRKFGTDIARSDILHVSRDSNGTLIGDLTDPSTLPDKDYDCFICTQTYNVIYDFLGAIHGTYQILKRGGVVLATVPGISQISRYDMDRWGDYWRFTTLSAQKAFEREFGAGNVEVDFFGNVLSSISFLEGLSSGELSTDELDYKDADYQLLVTIVARK